MTRRSAEFRTERLEVCISPSAKAKLQAAASASHRSRSDFVMESALSRAEEMLVERRIFVLNIAVKKHRPLSLKITNANAGYLLQERTSVQGTHACAYKVNRRRGFVQSDQRSMMPASILPIKALNIENRNQKYFRRHSLASVYIWWIRCSKSADTSRLENSCSKDSCESCSAIAPHEINPL